MSRPYIPKARKSPPKNPGQRFTPYEERVYRVIINALRPLTARKVADYSGISYPCAKKNLERLSERGLLKRLPKGNRVYWGGSR